MTAREFSPEKVSPVGLQQLTARFYDLMDEEFGRNSEMVNAPAELSAMRPGARRRARKRTKK